MVYFYDVKTWHRCITTYQCFSISRTSSRHIQLFFICSSFLLFLVSCDHDFVLLDVKTFTLLVVFSYLYRYHLNLKYDSVNLAASIVPSDTIADLSKSNSVAVAVLKAVTKSWNLGCIATMAVPFVSVSSIVNLTSHGSNIVYNSCSIVFVNRMQVVKVRCLQACSGFYYFSI